MQMLFYGMCFRSWFKYTEKKLAKLEKEEEMAELSSFYIKLEK